MRKSIICYRYPVRAHGASPQPARAGAFATELTQLLNHAQLVLEYLRQAQQLDEAIKQTTDMLKNSRILPGQVLGPPFRPQRAGVNCSGRPGAVLFAGES